MKKPRIFMCVALLVIWQVVAVSHIHDSKRSARQQSNTNTNSAVDEKQGAPKRKAGSFETAQTLLDKKGLPFDMEALTAPDWREKLAQSFGQIPEMQAVRYEPEPLDGVVIADTLYLPEKVELAGDTVILAKHLIFEGSNAVIRGNHSIYVLPVNTVRVIGTTLAGLNGQTSAKYSGQNSRSEKPSLPSWTEIQSFIEELRLTSGSLTIDTSWHNPNPGPKQRKGVRTSAFQIMGDRSGGPGINGADGGQGASGWNGANASPSYLGYCGGQPNGGAGISGGNGTDAYQGGNGGNGGSGGNGGDIALDLPQGDTGTYVEISRGGPGGNGGNGGRGGNGGYGGNGGTGGDGADCECNQGGQGSGGPGGPGGWGGRGGTGGTGGTGGRGVDSGHIRVNYQCELLANVSTDSAGGSGGDPGYGGPVGYGGLGGQGGLGGNKGGGECPICPNEWAVRGSDGSGGPSLGNGSDGYQGYFGAEGTSYEAEFVGFSVDCGGGGGGGGGCTDYWMCWDVYYCQCYEYELEKRKPSGDITPQYWDCYCWYWYSYCEYQGCW